MFGVFKGYNIKGVLFHQGYNNAMVRQNCRPKRYRVLMKLMVEGWREDFNDPELPVGVIGFCSGGDAQTGDNFEALALTGAPYIRESQRLGLDDVGTPDTAAFLPAFDVKVPGLHPGKKQAHGLRAARWALKTVYKMRINWDRAKLVSADRQADTMLLTFDKSVYPDDSSAIPEGFSIAGQDGKFYKAYARYPVKQGGKNLNNARSYDTTKIRVWSPLVKNPKAVRYGWAWSAMGNLKVYGKPWLPLYSFRTDNWDYPESDDPDESLMTRELANQRKEAAAALLDERKTKEADQAREILERLKTLSNPIEKTEN